MCGGVLPPQVQRPDPSEERGEGVAGPGRGLASVRASRATGSAFPLVAET